MLAAVTRPWTRFFPPGATGPYPGPGAVLADFARRAPAARAALVDGEGTLSYGELVTAMHSAAAAWRARGVRRGDRVVVRLPNSRAFVAAVHGALWLGGIAVPVSPLAGPTEVERVAADCAPRAVVDEPLPATDASGVAEPQAAPDGLAVLQYTSGTTGAPKGARMTHGNLMANALQNARWFGWTKDEVNLGVLPLFHTWGLCVCLHSTLAVGGTLVLAPRFDPEETLRLLDAHEATVLYGSATMFWRLLDAPPAASGLPTLRHVKAGAMLTQGNLKARWDERYPHAPLQQGYGLTEASPESHNNPPARFKAGTVGIPVADTDCRVVDPDDPARVLGPGERGEVCLRGPQMCDGYWDDPEATAAAFHDGWLRTGDLGVMDEEGYLTIAGRRKDMFKFRGWTVTPHRVEECLLRHANVREAAVVGRPDARDGEVPVAFVVADAGDDAGLAAALQAHCRAALAPHEVPREVRFVDAIPKNAVGKPLHRVLRDEL